MDPDPRVTCACMLSILKKILKKFTRKFVVDGKKYGTGTRYFLKLSENNGTVRNFYSFEYGTGI